MATAASIDVMLTANVARYRASMLEAGRITNQQLAGIRKDVANTSQSFQTFNRALGGFIGFQALKTASTQLSVVADRFSNIQARIRLAVGENANLRDSMNEVFEISQRTYSSFDSTATLVARTTRALVSNGEAAEVAFTKSLKLSEAINNAFLVSGATSQEAQNAIIQLSQGLAAGALRGEEYNSVAEQGSRITQALAEHLKVTTGQLRGMAAEGKLTAEVVTSALLGSFEKLQQEADKMPLTIGRAKTQLDNAFTKFIGEADQARGASQAIAAAISALAQNLGPVVSALTQLGIVAAGALGARTILAAKEYASGLIQQAAAAKAAEAATRQKMLADQQAAQATLLKARGEQVAAEQTAAAAAIDRQRIQSVIAMARAQEAAIRANALRATSEIELARLSERLTAVESARVAATKALGEARQVEVRANAALLASNRSLQTAYAATGGAAAAAATKATIGMRAAAAAQAGMTLAVRGFSTALALVGGPLGVVIIGVGLLASAFSRAKAQADGLRQSTLNAIEASKAFQQNQSREGAIAAQSELLKRERDLFDERTRLQTAVRGSRNLPSFLDIGGLAEKDRQSLRQVNAEIEETRRQINLNNKIITENSQNWDQNASAVEAAGTANQKHNEALDRQLQQLTARRLELTKGIQASLEYEAMQAQGVKTVAELDAATRSRIAAVAQEHAAVQAATEAKKGGARADREALAASKAQENQYTSIIDRINRQIALDREAMLVNDKMTAAQKLQVLVTEELKSAKNKLSEAEQARVRALLDEAVAQGAALKAMEDAKAAAESMLRLQNQLSEAARTQRQSNEIDLLGIGRGAEAVEQMRRVLDLQREHQRQVEDLNQRYAERGASEAAQKAYDAELQALQSHHEAMLQQESDYQQRRSEMQGDWVNGFQRAMDDYVARSRDVAGQTYDIFSSTFDGLENVMVDFLHKGSADWEGFFDNLHRQILQFVVRQQLTKWMQGLSNMNSGSGAMGGGGASSGWFSNFLGALFSNGKSEGGYTGPGARLQPAGVVHKGEVVWSQRDIARAGGVAAVEGMRRGIRGYADGGLVSGSSRVAVGRRPDDSDSPSGSARRARPAIQQSFYGVKQESVGTLSQEARREARIAQKAMERA